MANDSVRVFLIKDTDFYAGTFSQGLFKAKLADFGISGVTEIQNEASLIVNPNPAIDFIEISGLNKGLQLIVQEIRIYNTLGECVLVAQAPTSVQRIDVSGLEAGVYFIKIGNETKKFVVSK